MVFKGGADKTTKLLDVKGVFSRLKWADDSDIATKFYDDLALSTQANDGKIAANKWAAFFAEHEDEAFKVYKSFDDKLDDVYKANESYLENVYDFSKRTGKSADEIASSAKINENGVEQFLDELEDTPASGHWDLDPFQRGRNIEDDLGQNLPEPFKTIDIYDEGTGVATSIKSIDLDAKTYKNASKLKSRLKKYAEDLNQFTEYTLGTRTVGNAQHPINSKVLKVAIPRNVTGTQLDVINEIIQTFNNPNFTVEIVVLP